MAHENQVLIGLQRAEFDRAELLQARILQIQIVITALACASVFIKDPKVAYFMALLSFICALLWALISLRYSERRSLAERVRRATLVSDGLGIQLSSAELRDILSRFSGEEKEDAEHEDPNYYSSSAVPGNKRLAEMLEQSAFGSAFLFKKSALQKWQVFGGFIVVFLVLLFASLPFFNTQLWLGAVRILCSMLIFLVSTSIMGAALSFSSSARFVEQIGIRLLKNGTDAYPLHDLLLILGDYNAAVERAPVLSRALYKKHKEKLNRLWEDRRT